MNMLKTINPLTVITISLRAAAIAMAGAGNVAGANALLAIALAFDAGRATDDDLSLVAEKLKNGAVDATDWDDVTRRITTDGDRLQKDEA